MTAIQDTESTFRGYSARQSVTALSALQAYLSPASLSPPNPLRSHNDLIR